MRVWITGGRGFTGRNLTEYLTSKGIEVIATGRREINMYDGSEVKSFFQQGKFDFVLHCAISNSNLSGTMGETQSELHNNLTMFYNLAESMPREDDTFWERGAI